LDSDPEPALIELPLPVIKNRKHNAGTDAGARHDLYEILEERYGRRSTILTSKILVDKWHAVIGDPIYADAILDRLVHNAYRIDLTGDSLRRRGSVLAHRTVN
jgi:DNA replication protein DnaC